MAASRKHPLGLILALVAALALTPPPPLAAQDAGPGPVSEQGSGDTPWLEGVEIPPVPSTPTPEFPARIVMPDGSPPPATMSEDVPVVFQVDSVIFTAPVPTSWRNQPLGAAEWVGKTSVNWYFNEVARNQSFQASVSDSLPGNQMAVTPLNPCDDGAVTVFLNRGMRYEEEPGAFRRIYVTGGNAFRTRVTDITPPLCGLQITVANKKASIWTTENPPNHYPLPKFGDVSFQGDLVPGSGEGAASTIPHLELGRNTVVAPESLRVTLPAGGVVRLEPTVTDNDRVDDASVQFGLCELQGGVPRIIGQAGIPEIDLGRLDLPKQVHLFVMARDLTGNAGSLFIPVELK